MQHKLTFNFIQNLTRILPITKVQFFSEEIALYIKPSNLLSVIFFLKNNTSSQYKVLTCISGVDYPNRKLRFEISYDLLSLTFNNRLRLKVLQNELQSIESCESIFPASNWFECEIWDMFGIFFKNHSSLRRILTDYGFEGHPLRKDFPLNGYIEVRYSENQKRVVNETVEFSQEYRTFNFFGPWNG
jgi:NADH/F420H2 dehydrogenase subunit C